MTTPQTQQPNPGLLFETISAYQRTACLNAAIDLDLFTAIGEGDGTVEAIAKRVTASVRGVRVLCDYLTIIGFLSKENGRYRLTPDSAMFLDRRSPAYMGSMAKFFSALRNERYFDDIAAVVRKGGSAVAGGGTVEDENPIWVEFARSMAPMMEMPSRAIAGMLGAQAGEPWKVLDIAAGHGLFGIAIAQQNPKARITALDWSAVLEVARENAARRGVADRYSTIEGSAFEADFGDGYDIVLLTNFLHHFDPPTCESLLRKVYASLKPGGRAATLEFVPNEDRISPPMAASFSMMMLASTPSGDAYTFSEFDRMFRNAGFSRSEIHPVPPTEESLIISNKD
jgi:2-polyprenyl-3-methyl-5-hydroxy-6-metoxy-1,4-benzoquinol methylase